MKLVVNQFIAILVINSRLIFFFHLHCRLTSQTNVKQSNMRKTSLTGVTGTIFSEESHFQLKTTQKMWCSCSETLHYQVAPLKVSQSASHPASRGLMEEGRLLQQLGNQEKLSLITFNYTWSGGKYQTAPWRCSHSGIQLLIGQLKILIFNTFIFKVIMWGYTIMP